MRRRRYSRRVNIIRDVIEMMDKSSWWLALLIGVFFYLLLAWGFPAWVDLFTPEKKSVYSAITDSWLVRRESMVRRIGEVGLIAGCLIAAWKYFSQGRELGSDGRHSVGLFARLLALIGRRID